MNDPLWAMEAELMNLESKVFKLKEQIKEAQERKLQEKFTHFTPTQIKVMREIDGYGYQYTNRKMLKSRLDMSSSVAGRVINELVALGFIERIALCFESGAYGGTGYRMTKTGAAWWSKKGNPGDYLSKDHLGQRVPSGPSADDFSA